MIKEFRNEYHFLSNFSFSPIRIGAYDFMNVEAAFHSFKDASRQAEFQLMTGPEAKFTGRRVNLRIDWDEIKDELMYQIVKEKFLQNRRLKDQLLETGDLYLEEGNQWHDNYWGSCNCNRRICTQRIGKNKLGYILMRVRKELRE